MISMTRPYSKRKMTRDYYLNGDPHKNNKSGYRGVAYVMPNKKRTQDRYRAELQYDNVRYIGPYRDNPETAYSDYVSLVKEHVPAE